ncbi:MAG: hypothetical protein BMS9Abin36_0925 [Gammaproteobacteria bacterium]|nr:MAG: hypothetical protein BMS9Abin36_0925 [Gammaproteobacteria bacterium]
MLVIPENYFYPTGFVGIGPGQDQLGSGTKNMPGDQR